MDADGIAPMYRGARGRGPAQRHFRALRGLLRARLGLVTVTATLVAGCSSTGATSTPATGSPAPITVTSTLAGQSKLPLRIYWEAMPSVPATQIAQVQFLIDGGIVLVDRNWPFVYGYAGNMFVTSFLKPGIPHTFTVTAETLQGQVVWSSTVTAMVSAPPAPPPRLAGTWVRTVTAADLKKATPDSLPPPSDWQLTPGDWHLTIDPEGWWLVDRQGNHRLFDVVYQSPAILDMRPRIQIPDTTLPNIGGFCQLVDPIWFWTVAIGSVGMTLHPQGSDPCGNRAAVLEGTWRLVSK